MQSTRTSSAASRSTRQELRPAITIVGIVAIGIVAALMLPVWMAAIAMLVACLAIRAITVAAEPALEPVAIRREQRR
jgi:hypothetical protein